MRVSLLLTTIGRVDDLHRFFRSLKEQDHRDFEVLVVDDRNRASIQEVLRTYERDFPIQYVGSAAGHSRGLNMGLANATGDILAFPDDDCWYSPGLLSKVVSAFETNPGWGGVTGRCVTGTGTDTGRWDPKPGLIKRSNVWARACSVTMFLRRKAVGSELFDETLGVGAGTPWGAGEESDFLLRVIAGGHDTYYDPTLLVNHPEWTITYTPAVCAKARSYAMGFGRVMRKNNYALPAVAYYSARPLVAALVSMCSLRARKAAFYWAVFAGRTQGWMTGAKAQVACSVDSREMAR